MKTALKLAIMGLLTSFNLGAISLVDECASRIKVLDVDLSKVLQKRQYALRKMALVQEKKRELSLSYENYKKLILSLKQHHSEGLKALGAENEEEHRAQIVACLLKSGEMLQILRQIARSGDKELDDFSKNWRLGFPGYAR